MRCAGHGWEVRERGECREVQGHISRCSFFPVWSQLFLHSAVITERSVVGSYLGPYADYDSMLLFASRHGIKPQVRVTESSLRSPRGKGKLLDGASTSR